MDRLTITLSDARYRALRRPPPGEGRRSVSTVEECLDRAGIKTVASAADLVARARQRSRLTEAAALTLATKETRAARRPA